MDSTGCEHRGQEEPLLRRVSAQALQQIACLQGKNWTSLGFSKQCSPLYEGYQSGYVYDSAIVCSAAYHLRK